PDPEAATSRLTACRLAGSSSQTMAESALMTRVSAARSGPLSASGEEQVGVPELVPAIAGAPCRLVGPVEELAARHRLEQLEMRCLGVMPARDQPVHGAYPTRRCDDHVGPPLTG